MLNGKGSFYFADSGETYEGVFRDGTITGRGKLTKDNGDVYEGEFVDGKMSGQGTMTYASTGNKYTGLWRNNQKHGSG